MVATPDLTLLQVHSKCINPQVKAYIASMPSLPVDISLCEFLAILLQAASVAQIVANNENPEAKPGEKLNTYSLPVVGAVTIDVTNNCQFFTSTYKLNVITGVNLGGAIVPAYI